MGQKADELEKQVTKLSVHTVARLEREVEEAKISVSIVALTFSLYI
jgi:hypothetical protein